MKSDRRAIVVIAFAVVVVSFAAILIRLCTVPTAVIAAYRLGIASVVMLPLFVRQGARRAMTAAQAGRCVLAGFFLSLHFLFWIESLNLTTVASSVVLVTTSPIFAAVFAWFALGEGIGKRTMVAIMLCFAGSAIIGRGSLDLGPGAFKGNIFALVGAAAFGAHFVTGRSARKSLGFLEYAFVAYASSAVMLIAWAVARGHALTGFDPANYLWLLLLALGPQVFGHTSLNWALRYLPAPKIAISILGEPIGSSLLAWVFFSELPSRGLFMGAPLILFGVYIAMTDRAAGRRPA